MHTTLNRSRQALVDCLRRVAPGDGLHLTAVPKLKLLRASSASDMAEVLYEPALCLLAKGRKQPLVGEARIAYDRSHHLVAVHDIPVSGQVVEASSDAPYLSIWLDIDPVLVGSLLLERDLPAGAPAEDEYTRVFGLSPSQDMREMRSFLLQPGGAALPERQIQSGIL